MKKILFVLFILIFSGCSEKINLDILNKDKHYENALQYTKRGEISVSLETKAVITATYLNSVDADIYTGDDYFLIGIYIPDDDKYSNSLINPNAKLTLNGKGFKTIELVQENSEEYKRFAFLHKWAKYYKVKFEQQDLAFIELIYEDKRYGKTILKFDKNL